jgi:hypothetical protein
MLSYLMPASKPVHRASIGAYTQNAGQQRVVADVAQLRNAAERDRWSGSWTAARTKEALIEAISEALGAVTPKDARSWFVHSAYEPRDLSL